MSGGHVLGSVPVRDPMDEVRRSLSQMPEESEIRWNDRSSHRPWEIAAGLTIAVVVTMMIWPLYMLVILSMVLVVVLLSQDGNRLVAKTQRPSGWTRLQYKINGNVLRRRARYIEYDGENGRDRRVIALTMSRSESTLQGDMSRLVRGVPTWGGLCLEIVLRPERPTSILNSDVLTSSSARYLDSLSSDRLHSFIQSRGGLWAVNAMLAIQATDEQSLMTLAASVRGAVPSAYWRLVSPSELISSVGALEPVARGNGFYALGSELDKWLVQLRTELAYEVGDSVPGQFVAPIRTHAHDYRLGQVINPDTLDLGPEIGVSHDDLEQGLLICGGTDSARLSVLANIVRRAIGIGKHVLVVTSSPSDEVLCSLSDESVLLTLGRDLVLNPVDCESIPRNEYVPMLLSSLETVARVDLSNAPDFELAVGRAVALPGSTLADVTLESDQHLSPTLASGGGGVPPPALNSASKAGMDAVRTLYQASGAAAFYGRQSVSIEQLAQVPLSVSVISIGSLALDVFAWELFCIKLSTLSDKDVVVVLDGPRNMEIAGTEYARRAGHLLRLIRLLHDRVSLVICTERPSLIPDAILSSMRVAVALRLKSRYDIAAVTDLLSLKVIGTGLHSKARESVRESSYLSVMDDSTALLVRHGRETAIPIRLDPSPPLREPDGAIHDRTERLINSNRPQVNDDVPRSLLGQIAGRDLNLATQILHLLERYQPLTEEAVRRFIMSSSPQSANSDVQDMLRRLTDANLILPGSEYHSGVSYRNYRLTMKGTMALRQATQQQESQGVIR